ncbi:hypothetical protein DQQ10_18370 [Pseudochryseolinea flava]|uniref:Uncharacterized protein n=1 Tax=Pseudochryseolinea flava TaxID=2059302 RepID=A0A364XYZ8_9BACT|nr:hypothetical protein DQQ10_18370 [Pseudochryseolinea flava]
METIDVRLQRRIHASLFALLFLTVLLGVSVLLEGCTKNVQTKKGIVPAYQASLDCERVSSEGVAF